MQKFPSNYWTTFAISSTFISTCISVRLISSLALQSLNVTCPVPFLQLFGESSSVKCKKIRPTPFCKHWTVLVFTITYFELFFLQDVMWLHSGIICCHFGNNFGTVMNGALPFKANSLANWESQGKLLLVSVTLIRWYYCLGVN